MRRNILITSTVGGALIVALILVSLIPERGGSTVPAPSAPAKGFDVVTLSASRAAISQVLEFTGSVEPFRIALLASPAEGPVAELRVREGDRARAGDTLATLGRTRGVEALAASWREEVRTADANFQRVEHLLAQNLATSELLDQAGARLKSAKAQLLKAEESARDYTITAPWDGVVSRLIVKEGQFVAPRAPVLEMFDPISLVIRVSIPERYATMVMEGMHVDVDLDAYPGRPQAGYVSRVYPQLDLPIRARPVEVSLAESPELLPGMFARLRIPLQTVDDAIVLPAEAIVTTAEGQTIAFVVEGGKAFQRRVVTGLLEGNRVEVVEGIGEGDQVIIAGTEKIKAGSAVRIAQSQGNRTNGAAAAQPVPAAMPEGTQP